VYISITRPRRGYYHMRVEALVPDPKNTGEGNITEIHTRRLERDIRNNPDLWLWTHRRWKHRRPPNAQ
jgi:KDO2-lipid IV(A) lauroyltransferase